MARALEDRWQSVPFTRAPGRYAETPGLNSLLAKLLDPVHAFFTRSMPGRECRVRRTGIRVQGNRAPPRPCDASEGTASTELQLEGPQGSFRFGREVEHHNMYIKYADL